MSKKKESNVKAAIDEANLLYNSGLKHNSLRHHDEALVYFQQALKKLIENDLVSYELTEKTIMMIADAFDAIANAQPENLQYRVDTLALMKDGFPMQHPASGAQLARMYNNLADNYRKTGNFKQALDYFSKGLIMLKNYFPFGSHPYFHILKENVGSLCAAVNDQGVALMTLGKEIEALEAFESSLYALTVAFPEGNNLIIGARDYLAKILVNLHKTGVNLIKEDKKNEALKIFVRISDSLLKGKIEPAEVLLK